MVFEKQRIRKREDGGEEREIERDRETERERKADRQR